MTRFAHYILLLAMMVTTGSCNNVGFKSGSDSTGTKECTGDGCTGTPGGGGGTAGYEWHETGFGLCSKPCGGGDKAQVVECRRVADKVVVADTFCTGTKPVSTQTCNASTCASPNTWTWGDFGACSKTCGGGVQIRNVVCQNQSGQTVADQQCSNLPKPSATNACSTDPCPGGATNKWTVTTAFCPLTCANTVSSVTDTAVCTQYDGQTIADGACPSPKPAQTHACNQDDCPQTYTYQWAPGAYSDCSRTCGGGVQTRAIACQRNDGLYVDASLCGNQPKPGSSQVCGAAACPPATRQVTQTATVTPAANSVDVILIIDDSSSMKDDQTKLAQRLSGFIADLDAQKIDYQVCLTTTDISYYAGSPIKWQGLDSFIMTKSSPDKNNVFINTINALGAEWSSDEQAIKATYLMTRDFRSSGCMRPQATLSTIVISDEDERSVGGNQSLSKSQYQPLTSENMPDTLISYVHQTFDQAGFTKPFIWNSIIVKPGDAACESQEDAQQSPSFPGTLYAQLSTKTGGAIGSICDADYSQNLKIIKDRVVNNMPGMTLECTPVGAPTVTFQPSTVQTSVSVNGNQLKFTPALPEGTQITAKYACAN